MFYQKSTNRVASGNIVSNSPVGLAFPYSNANKTVEIGTADSGSQAKVVGNGTSSSVTNNVPYGTFGMLPDPLNDNNYFACVESFPPASTGPYLCGVLYFDGATGSATTYYNFTGFT